MGTSKGQLEAVISQENKALAFYSKKLNLARVNYTTTERELLFIMETVKKLRNILLGQQIKVYFDHKSLHINLLITREHETLF